MLRAPLPPQALPADFARDPSRSTRVDVLRTYFGQATVTALKTRASALGVTLFELLLALWVGRVYAWTGLADRLVMVPTLGRDGVDGLLDVVGCFANPLPLRHRVVPGEAFKALVDRVSSTCREAFRFADQRCERPLLAAIAFTFPHFEDAEPRVSLDALDWRLDELWNEIGNDDVDAIFLATVLSPDPDTKELLLSWTWQKALFRRETFEALARAFSADVEALAAGQDPRVPTPAATKALDAEPRLAEATRIEAAK